MLTLTKHHLLERSGFHCLDDTTEQIVLAEAGKK